MIIYFVLIIREIKIRKKMVSKNWNYYNLFGFDSFFFYLFIK